MLFPSSSMLMTFTDKYDSDYGVFSISGVKVEVMGNLKVFRDGVSFISPFDPCITMS